MKKHKGRSLTANEIFRAAILYRDDCVCQRCKKHFHPSKLAVHHIDKRKDESKLFDLSNCITYCDKCHSRVHVEYPDYEAPMTIAQKRREKFHRKYMKRPLAYRQAHDAIYRKYPGFRNMTECCKAWNKLNKKWGFE